MSTQLNRKNLVARYHRLPEAVRIAGTATVGLVIALITYEVVFAINPIEPRASVSWLVAFIIGVARQHALHRWLSFKHPVPYWRSLGRAYVMDASAALLTTGLNWLLTGPWELDHRVAWLACMVVVAAYDFVLLKRYVFRV